MSLTTSSRSTAGPAEDLTGRKRLAWNVLTGWASYAVFLVAGFVLPRCIDRYTGQAALGVWDFAWSLVAYFGLLQVGLGSTVNRFVASLRAAGDLEGLRRMVSTVTAMLAIVAAAVAALAALIAWMLPTWFGATLGPLAGEARWVVLLLGIGLAVQQLTDAFNGVMTGCHRWDLHNAIASAFYAAQIAAMLVVLPLGGGLVGLSCVACVGMVATQVTRVIVAYRICPGLEVAARHVSLDQARRLLSFGGKSFVPKVAELLMDQTTNVLVLAYLGPAALAVFSRPRALIRHVTAIVSRFSFVLEPTAGSLHATGDRAALRALMLRTTSMGAYIALPMTLGLAIMGDPLIHVWMGPDYAVGAVLLILVLGNFVATSQMPAMSVLLGMNAHGRPGVAHLAASAVAAGLAFVALGLLHGGLAGAALAVTVPLAVTSGVYIPSRACRLLDAPMLEYWRRVWTGPLLATAPYGAALALGRWWAAPTTLPGLVATMAPAGLILAATYWRFVVPPHARARVRREIRGRLAPLMGSHLDD
jgi:O-antigen/teichoic acid export membrane protein